MLCDHEMLVSEYVKSMDGLQELEAGLKDCANLSEQKNFSWHTREKFEASEYFHFVWPT